MNKVLALILAGGQGERLSILSEERAKPAVIFGGKYRIIDFTLSNCINSGISRIGILTQYRPRSLNDHIGIGKPWDLDRSDGGVILLQPFIGRDVSFWYRGTADAVFQNLDFVEEHRKEQILILAGDHIYSMRYDDMIAFHRARGADVTVAVSEVPIEEASRYGIITLDEEDRVVAFDEKPPQPKSNLVSMGIYVFNRDALIERLTEDALRPSTHDFGRDIIPAMVGQDRVYGYRFKGYWRDVGTIEAYWQANMDLLVELPEFNLYDPYNVVRTKSSERPPAKIGPRAHMSRSLVCHGCIINGYVERSILSPGVFVEEGAVIRDSILFDDVYVERDAVINRAILDKEVRVGSGAQIGYGDDLTPNRQEPHILNTGITLVGKRTHLPPGLRVGRNCKIGPGLLAGDFPSPFVASGESVNGKQSFLARTLLK
ncbi:MAG: glucose-1-phosphate adenylyltransferase [Chloroflexi bacterium]|nr:glucose-1-phosphate adenylyltransferase [Chloroflexota bacterium]